MTKHEFIQALVGVLLLAFLGEALWLYEIVVKVGWNGLAWLKKDLISPFGVSFCAATAYLLPYVVKYKKIDTKVILTWLSLACINIAAYYFGDAVLKNLFSPLIALLTFWQSVKMRLFGLIAVGLFAFGYYYITDQLIIKVRKQQASLFLVSAFLMFFLGNITVFFIRGFGHSDGLSDAIKMGYPQMWISLLLGFSSMITLSFFSVEEKSTVTADAQRERKPLY